MTDRARYILDFYWRFQTPEEKHADRCAMLMKMGRDPKVFGRDSYTPETERRLRNGPDQCLEEIADRIERDHASEIYFHTCPKCGGLCRTPKAQQCRYCHHDWHIRA